VASGGGGGGADFRRAALRTLFLIGKLPFDPLPCSRPEMPLSRSTAALEQPRRSFGQPDVPALSFLGPKGSL